VKPLGPDSTSALPPLPHLAQQIVAILLKREPVSGEDLAGRLGVSRTAVWKHVRLLREVGFIVEARPGKGYRLTQVPDLLLPVLIQARLKTKTIGRTIHHFPQIESTNTKARELAEQGAPEGTLVVAEYQTRGKGRMSRPWESPAGQNLLFSLILRPTLPPQQTFNLILLVSVALCRSIQMETNLELKIKWPNDLYCRERKMAGILAEFAAESDRLNYVIIGVGLNVNWSPAALPEDAQATTSILQETGMRASRSEILASFLSGMEQFYRKAQREGYQFIQKAWEHYSLIKDRPVRVMNGKETWTGVAQGIDPQGALVVILDSGEKKRFLAGDVHLRIIKT
jgi:BirA family transcriptional regulator, biotin operon repressor / biotin---[acetyl-CoA-carboxylase] ligase